MTPNELKIKSGLFQAPQKLIEEILKNETQPSKKNFIILTDNLVERLYGNILANEFLKNKIPFFQLSFPKGEKSKTRKTKELLENKLLEKRIGQEAIIIAVGGGVTTDLGGYIAATYGRGIPLINIPTTLLGMVDAAIGGKNGVNTIHGKNLIGTLYPPKKVIIDPDCLKTLKKKQIKEGLSEVIKKALVFDASLFSYLEEQSKNILNLETDCLKKIIYASCRIKLEIVKESETNKSVRDILNFGHTIGHALEQVSHYSLSHGEAVALGLIVESAISKELKILDQASYERIENLLKTYGMSPLFKKKKRSSLWTLEKLKEAMSFDKKSQSRIPMFVLIEKIGAAFERDGQFCHKVDEAIIHNCLTLTKVRS